MTSLISCKVRELTPPASRQHARAEDEQEIANDGPGERRLDDLREAAREREDRDDEFRGVPERRVEEASDSRSCMLSEFLRTADEEPGERDDRDPGHDEHEHARTEREVEDPAHRH